MGMQMLTGTRRRIGLTRSLIGPLWLIATALATVPVFWFGFEMLAQEWARPEFRFKPLVPVLSALLFLQVLRRLPPGDAADTSGWFGVPVVAGALLLAILGNLLQIDDFVFVAIIVWVIGLIIAAFGLRRGLAFWAPIGSLFLMLPVPRFVVAPIHHFLEAAAAQIALSILWLRGISAIVDGQILDFGIYQIRLTEATAGVVNFLPILLVFFFFATVYRGPLWTRALPLILAAPVMVLLAAVKVVLLGYAANRGGAEAAGTVLRLANGWVFFFASVTILLGITLLARRVAGSSSSGRVRFDVNLAHIGRIERVSRPMLAAAFATIAISGTYALNPGRASAEIAREPFLRFPQSFADWQGTRTALPSDLASVLNADDYVNIDFYHPAERAPVNFWSAYYYAQEEGRRAIHSPEDCLPLDDWNIVSIRAVEVDLGEEGTMTLNRVVIRKDNVKGIVYYWFDGRGRRIANERVARLMVKLDGFLKGRTDGALMRYVTTVLPDEREDEAEARLQRLLRDTIGQVPRFVPA